MKRTFLLIIAFTISLTITITKVNAQSLEETLSNLSSTAGKSYVAPVISAFGSNLNSGWVSKLPEATKLALHIDFKIIGMGSFFSDENKTFNTNGDFYFSSSQIDQILSNSDITSSSIGQQNYTNLKNEILATQFNVGFSGPTIIGSEDEHLKITFPGRTITSGQQTYTVDTYELEVEEVKGFLKDLKILPTAAVQLTVGTVAGTNVAIRYFPDVDLKDMGKFTFWGLGAIHNPGVWLKHPLPLDLGVGYFYQKMKVGDIFESSASQFGVYAGKTFGGIIAFSPFVGLVVESSKTTVKYDYQSNQTVSGVQVPKAKLEFELEGENSSGVILGFNLKLAVVNINADYKIAKTKTASAGVSFGF